MWGDSVDDHSGYGVDIDTKDNNNDTDDDNVHDEAKALLGGAGSVVHKQRDVQWLACLAGG